MSNKSKTIKKADVEIVFEDDDIIAINKPAGLMVHPDGRDEGPFLTDWIMKCFPKSKNVGEPARDLKGEPISRPGIVHRLDRETSGAMLVAKTPRGFACLKNQFQDRKIKKDYITFVWGDVGDEFGTINRPIGRSSGDFRKWSAQRGARGELREAETYWTRIGVAEVEDKALEGGTGKVSLVEAEPRTGRTHQIRVHFNALNHPVVGDSLYAPKRPMVLGFKRLALHSWKIEFRDCEGKIQKAIAPLPKDFVVAIKKIGVKKPLI